MDNKDEPPAKAKATNPATNNAETQNNGTANATSSSPANVDATTSSPVTADATTSISADATTRTADATTSNINAAAKSTSGFSSPTPITRQQETFNLLSVDPATPSPISNSRETPNSTDATAWQTIADELTHGPVNLATTNDVVAGYQTGNTDTSRNEETPNMGVLKAPASEKAGNSLSGGPSKPVMFNEKVTDLEAPNLAMAISEVFDAESIVTNADTSTRGQPSKGSDGSDSNDSFEDIELDADLLDSVLFYLGSFGTYQKFLFVAMIPFAVFFAWVYFAPMFLIITPQPFWCYVPELAALTKEERRDLTAPGVSEGNWDGCMVFVADWHSVILNMQSPSFDTPKKPCTSGFEFEHKEIPFETVVSERQWVCDDATHVPTGNSIFFAGAVVGAALFGWVADSYGRVPALMAVNIVGGVGGVATTLTKGVWDFYVCRFISGMSFDNCIMIAYILVLEYVGPSHRTLFATMPIALYYGAGAVALPWIAYFVSNWRIFTLITTLPMFIVLIAPWTMPESARWLVSKGRVDDAVKVFRKFERVNKAKVPPKIMDAFIKSAEMLSHESKEEFSTIFKSKLLRLTFGLMMSAYCIVACIYDVIVRLSESFGLNFFVTFTINAAAEIPSVLVVAALLDKLGRRNLVCGPMFIAATCAFIAVFVPQGVIQVMFAVVARFFINLSLTVMVQWATEILPTPFRATGSAFLHMSGFASSCLAPFIVYLGTMVRPAPLLIISALGLVASGFSLWLPETKGLEMPQTTGDAEIIIKQYSLFRRPEMKELSRAFSNVVKKTVSEPLHRSKQGRVSMILSGTSKALHSKISIGDIPKKP